MPLIVDASGGDGGNVTHSKVHGGGGQGVVVYSIVQPTTNITTNNAPGNGGNNDSGASSSAGNGGGTDGDGIIAEASGPLPIELISFEALQEAHQVRLTWATASESNNDFFTIERSRPPTSEGFNWEIITTVAGAGYSDVILNYKAYDTNPYTGRSFYRLKQTDFDGQFAYSPIVSVQVELVLKIYPNPASDRLYIQMNDEEIINSKVLLFNTMGQELVVKQQRVGSRLILFLDQLTSGVYLLEVKGPNIAKIERIIVK